MQPSANNQTNDENFSKFNLISWLEKDLISVPGITSEQVFSLCRKLYPVETSQNTYVALYRTLMQYFSIQTMKGQSYELVSSEVVRTALPINESMSKALCEFFKKDIIQGKIKSLLQKNNAAESQKKAPSQGLLETLDLKYSGSAKNTKEIISKGFASYNKESSAKSSQIAESYMKIRNQTPNLLSKTNSSLCLICDKELGESSFECEDCGGHYHRKCQPRKNNCSSCQLKNMNPLHRVSKELFVGVLRKGIKKHEIEFKLGDEDLILRPQNGKHKQDKKVIPYVQVRSIRLKDYYDQVANYINLFPDACTIMLNSKLMKEFIPLHRQSSLKYRRDDPVKLTNYAVAGVNKLVITQRFVKSDIGPDERVEVQNHLVGIYIVEQLEVPRKPNAIEQFLMKNPISSKSLGIQGVSKSDQEFMKSTQSLSFQESEALLKESLLLDAKHEVSCDTLKTPLVCSLTLGRMENPGRSIFCKHFSCFDVKNFFIVNSRAQLPRWQCPICKAPAYKFNIDPIMRAILDMLRDFQKKDGGKFLDENEPTQVVFTKDCSFQIVNKSGRSLHALASGSLFTSIYDLPIQGKLKRFRSDDDPKEELEGLKPRKIMKGNSQGNDSEGKIEERESKQKIVDPVANELQKQNRQEGGHSPNIGGVERGPNKPEAVATKMSAQQIAPKAILQAGPVIVQANMAKPQMRKAPSSNKNSAFIIPKGCQVLEISD